MADVIDYKIHWDDIQFVQIILDPQETVVAEAGTLFFKDNSVEMSTWVEWGIKKWIGRMFTWESFFITSFTNTWSSRKQVCFAAPYTWKIIPLDLSELWWEFICQKDSFLCAAKWTDVKIFFNKKIWTWLFWWEWFILQKLSWDGMSFIHAGWSIVKMDLKEWQEIEVDTWCLVGFHPSVSYDIKMVGWLKNSLFGWEGLFLATLRWPGKIYLQSLPFSKMADRIISASWLIWRKWDTWFGWVWDLASIAWKFIK